MIQDPRNDHVFEILEYYYQFNVPHADKMLVKSMTNYHNLIKYYLFRCLRHRAPNVPIDVLDLACGRGGDLNKWQDAHVRFVLAIDLSLPNLADAQYNRAPQLEKDPRYPLEIHWIWGDVREPIFNGQAGRDARAQADLESLMVKRRVASFDIVSCQFAFHYFTENEDLLEQVLWNVSTNLKPNGLFIGTTLDGEQVFKQLGKTKELRGLKNNRVIWEITKEPQDEELHPSGQKIDVFNISIGKAFPEYLVNFAHLIQVAKRYGLIPINNEQIPGLMGIESFGTEHLHDAIRELSEDLIKTKPKKNEKEQEVFDIKKMSIEEQKYSFMNNYFVFIKIGEPEINPFTIKKAIPITITPESELSKPPLPQKKGTGFKLTLTKSTLNPQITPPSQPTPVPVPPKPSSSSSGKPVIVPKSPVTTEEKPEQKPKLKAKIKKSQ